MSTPCTHPEPLIHHTFQTGTILGWCPSCQQTLVWTSNTKPELLDHNDNLPPNPTPGFSPNSLPWETRIPASKTAKGPYEFTPKSANLNYTFVMSKIQESGTYGVTLGEYKYWIIHGGLARRKIPIQNP